MFPPIFSVCSQDNTVKSLLGSNPVRLFPFGDAPQKNKTLPYAVWQSVSGSPDNYLGDIPDADSYTTQIDIYGKTGESVREVAKALRDVLEPVAYIVAWRTEARDIETMNYRFSFDVDWIVKRD
jgi:hypothetical protein